MVFPITSNVQGLKVRTWRGAGINQGFPGGSVVENLPASAGDMGSIPELGESHMQQSNSAGEPQLFSLCSRVCEPQLLKAKYPRAHALQQEKPPQLESSLHLPQLQKSVCSNKGLAQPKMDK